MFKQKSISLFWNLVSWLLGLIDLGIVLFTTIVGALGLKVFRKGLGDFQSCKEAQNRIMQAFREDDHPSIQKFVAIDGGIQWIKGDERNTSLDGLASFRKGRFRSPFASYLPPESKNAHFTFVSPSAPKCTSPVYIIMLPGFGEITDFPRSEMARFLAVKYGWSSIILTPPYFSERKPAHQTLFFQESMSDLLLMFQGVIQEGAALACHYLLASDQNRVCITGFSLGGGLGAYSSALTMLVPGVDASRLVYVPFAPVYDAASQISNDGLLGKVFCWEGLREHPEERAHDIQQKCMDMALNATKMLDILLETLQTKTKQCGIGAVRAVSMIHDRVAPRKYGLHFHSLIRRLVKTNEAAFAEHWLPGGHLSGFVARPYHHTMAIVEGITAVCINQSTSK